MHETAQRNHNVRRKPRERRLAGAAALAGALGAGASAAAEVPRVVTDIAPVQSLVAQVMGDLGTPDLVLPPGASPHGHALRPSEARALQSADLVFWVGPDLTPWLEDPLETLAQDARHVALMEAEGVRLLEMRDGPVFDALVEAAADAHGHDHDHDHDHAEEAAAHDHDHDHDDVADAHEDHDHGDEMAETHDDHGHDHDHGEEVAEAHGHDHGHDHAHGEHDPHVWLHPDNAAAWLRRIEAALSDADPANAETYATNAAAALDGLGALEAELSERLAPVEGARFLVFHDAYQYFEDAFGLQVAGSIATAGGEKPSAARLAELRASVEESGVSCIAAEPQFNPGLISAVGEGTGAPTAVLDPIGVALSPGRELYADMMRGLADALAGCVAKS